MTGTLTNYHNILAIPCNGNFADISPDVIQFSSVFSKVPFFYLFHFIHFPLFHRVTSAKHFLLLKKFNISNKGGGGGGCSFPTILKCFLNSPFRSTHRWAIRMSPLYAGAIFKNSSLVIRHNSLPVMSNRSTSTSFKLNSFNAQITHCRTCSLVQHMGSENKKWVKESRFNLAEWLTLQLERKKENLKGTWKALFIANSHFHF